MIELLNFYIPVKYFLWSEVFSFFMLQYQKIICSAKNVIKESWEASSVTNGFKYKLGRWRSCLKETKKSYPTLAYDRCILQLFELSHSSHFSTTFVIKLNITKIEIISNSKISWAVLLSTRTNIFMKLL